MDFITADIISIWGVREPLSTFSHMSGAFLAGLGVLVLRRRARARSLPRDGRIGLTAYGFSVIFAFTASALFHYFPWKPAELVFFKKLDHAAIFAVIAGTCTVLLNAGRSPHRRLFIIACWTLCAAAAALKMLVWPMSLWMSAAIYLTVGWAGAASVLSALRDASWTELRLLVYGMIVLTISAVVFATETPVIWEGVVEGHELFHILVLIGAALHFHFILRYCTVPDGLCGDQDDDFSVISLIGDRREN